MDEQTKARIELQLIRRLSEGLTENKEFYALVGTHTVKVNIWFIDYKMNYNIDWVDVKRFALDDPLEDLCMAQDAVDAADNNFSIAKQNVKGKIKKENTLVFIGKNKYYILAQQYATEIFVPVHIKNITTSDSWAIRKGLE